ncbi:hypothetical protein F2Q69_00061130 [Brassica cretica]|uniref:Uncharacterized protein n=1 Tax=Brassica cretica TaxID=69181 RepID=A0A8S9RN41_BRACR|nr:hypothetical protein F2Q69_00061130 [Brassica cretica]
MRADNGTRGLHPESRRRDFRHFVRAGSAPRVSRPRVETSTLPLLRACGFTIPRRRASSPPSWSATSSPSVASDRAMTACPEAPECFSPSQSSFTIETPHRKLLMYRSSPPRRDRISGPWYPPPPSRSSFFSRRRKLEEQQWWNLGFLHFWSFIFRIITI